MYGLGAGSGYIRCEGLDRKLQEELLHLEFGLPVLGLGVRAGKNMKPQFGAALYLYTCQTQKVLQPQSKDQHPKQNSKP